MIKKLLTIFAVAGTMATNAQTLINESFVAPFTPSTAGWVLVNNSTPAAVNNWRQGVGTQFASNSGAPNDYYAADWTAGGTSTSQVTEISNWLITPTVTIYNGARLSFFTRKVGGTPVYPDRMVVRMSTAGTASTIPTGTASVGSFSTTLLDINPLYASGTASAVTSGSVNGYPQTWTQYNLVVSGVTGTVTGRFAFHYLVANGGGAGNNSDAVGVDDVMYSLPCSGTVASFTTCPSSSVTLNVTGFNPGATFAWAPVTSTVSSVVVTPSTTSVYSVTITEGTIVCPAKTATVTIGSALSVMASASSNTICAGSTTSLMATSAASSYTWLPVGLNTAMVAVSPTANTTYTVAGQNGACFGAATVAIVVNASPNTSVVVAGPTNSICIGSGTINFIASGAVSYIWSSPNSSLTTATVSANTPTAAGAYNIIVNGVGANGCTRTATTSLVMQTCTGLNEIAVANNINVFPNPFVNELNVSGISGNVVIINTLGKVVYSSVVKENEAINTANLAKGVYFVKIKDSVNNTEKTIKVIKE
ncbi:MAG: choice-of-anchor J domain-containing protein [Bacteroidota bacterium]|jgi:hypothetical protein